MEGQEFPQSMTYVGNPPLLPYLAPEMDAEIDSVMATLRSNGYRVGMTLRPSHFLYGTSLPSSCNYNSNPDYTDRFLLVDGIPSSRYYLCNSSGVFVNFGGIGDQMEYTDVASVVKELANKVSYANTRWGANIFYVDSTVWSGGAPLLPAIWQQLQSMFPNCLFMPEESTDATYADTAPYHDANQSNIWSSASHRFLYPSAFAAINLGNTSMSELSSGYANVMGTTMTQTSGASFATDGSWNGQTIYLNGIAYTVSSVSSTKQLTLTTPAPLRLRQGVTWRVGVLTGLVKAGMAHGDVYLYTGWFTVWQQAATAALWQEANYIAVVTDTSSGKVQSLGGSPGASYTIPLKMTITFADTRDDLATSTLTCAGGASCSMDLSKIGIYQVSYFDLNGKLVAQGSPICLSAACLEISIRRR
jgi:hypothetical protein